MGRITYCLMCLGTEVKMHQMTPSMLVIYNESITREYTPSAKQMYACYECAYLLHKYAKFRRKCSKSYSILWSRNPASFEVTKEDLRHIDRKKNKLESSLTVCNTTDSYLYIQDCTSPSQINTQIKTETTVHSIEEKGKENTLQTEERFPPPIYITTTYYNNDKSEMYTEGKTNIKRPEHEEEDDYQSEEILEITKLDPNLENIGICDSKVDSVSPIKLDDKCFEINYNSIIGDGHLNTINNKENISQAKKRKLVIQNENIIHGIKCRKINDRNNDSFKSRQFLNEDYKPIMKKKSIKIKNSCSNVSVNKSKKDYRLTLDSSFFKDQVTILKLTPDDANRELLLRRESRNYKMNSHKCNLCYRGFISDATYEAHMKKHSMEYGNGTIKCQICQLSFSDKRSLGRHKSRCHRWKFLCKTCPYVCFNINQAKSHIQSHKGKKYTCKECGETFRFPNSLSTHIRLKHSIELVCDFCGSTFASAQGIDCHKRLRHRKEKNEHLGPQCTECDVHFASELAWKRHRVLCSRHDVHNGCEVCGETFSNRAELRMHSREHGGRATTAHSRSHKLIDNKPRPCELCNKVQPHRKAYVNHMKIEHQQSDTENNLMSNCVCEVCGRTFRHRSFLIAHQRKHTDEKPFSCPQCDKKFKNPYAVKMHLLVHTNEYTFKCHLCEKAFGDRGKLNRHLKGHLAIRPYKCSYCDRTFIFQCEERLHTKYVHCKEPYPKRNRRKKDNFKNENIK